LASDLERLRWQTVLLGLAVALVVVFRLRFLERRSDLDEHQMRQLSQQLVNTQEEERKNLSRELHDHVAQVLTGLRMELGRLERLTAPLSAQVAPVVAECKGLVDGMFRTVRNLALGLRPSMLDDFGLQAALEWLVRDFTGRYSITIDLGIEGDFDGLPDKHRTCLYRVVQEALTNSVRHAYATTIDIRVSTHARHLQVAVRDDGIGLDPARRRSGLGLRGLEERVKELDGSMTITRQPRGTMLAVRLPVPSAPSREVPLARAAG
jgi:signal transduction histidine kinase